MDKPVQSPFTIAIDTREQQPFAFAGLKADARQQYRPLLVRTVVKTLQSGDYSVEGLDDLVAVERKSKADLFGTLGQGRERFVRELERLDAMQFACVVIEAEATIADQLQLIGALQEEARLLREEVNR